MRVYEASTLISAEFGGIRDLSRHLSLNYNTHTRLQLLSCLDAYFVLLQVMPHTLTLNMMI